MVNAKPTILLVSQMNVTLENASMVNVPKMSLLSMKDLVSSIQHRKLIPIAQLASVVLVLVNQCAKTIAVQVLDNAKHRILYAPLTSALRDAVLRAYAVTLNLYQIYHVPSHNNKKLQQGAHKENVKMDNADQSVKEIAVTTMEDAKQIMQFVNLMNVTKDNVSMVSAKM